MLGLRKRDNVAGDVLRGTFEKIFLRASNLHSTAAPSLPKRDEVQSVLDSPLQAGCLYHTVFTCFLSKLCPDKIHKVSKLSGV
jgi:hypothetical protein